MEAWIDRLAERLEQTPLEAAETSQILGVARDVAHRVERRLTPLSTFLLGLAVGRRLAEGAARAEALEREIDLVRGLLPALEEPGDQGPVAGR